MELVMVNPAPLLLLVEGKHVKWVFLELICTKLRRNRSSIMLIKFKKHSISFNWMNFCPRSFLIPTRSNRKRLVRRTEVAA